MPFTLSLSRVYWQSILKPFALSLSKGVLAVYIKPFALSLSKGVLAVYIKPFTLSLSKGVLDSCDRAICMFGITCYLDTGAGSDETKEEPVGEGEQDG